MENPKLYGRQIWTLRDIPEVTLASTALGWQIFAPQSSPVELVSRIKESGITEQAFERRRDALQALEMLL